MDLLDADLDCHFGEAEVRECLQGLPLQMLLLPPRRPGPETVDLPSAPEANLPVQPAQEVVWPVLPEIDIEAELVELIKAEHPWLRGGGW